MFKLLDIQVRFQKFTSLFMFFFSFICIFNILWQYFALPVSRWRYVLKLRYMLHGLKQSFVDYRPFYDLYTSAQSIYSFHQDVEVK